MSAKDAKAERKWTRDELARLRLEPGDYVILHPGPTKDYTNVAAFADEIRKMIEPRGLGPIIVLPPFSDLVALTTEQLALYGLIRVLPALEPGVPINWEAIEDDAHQMVRMGFKSAREQVEATADAEL